MNVEVRSTTRDDVRAIADMQLASWPSEYDGIAPRERIVNQSVERRVAAVARQLGYADKDDPNASGRPGPVESPESIESFVAVDDRHFVVGHAVITRAGGELVSLVVHPEARTQGVGRALVGHAEHVWRDAGLSTGTAWVIQANANACRFYEALGWAADGAERLHRGGPPPLFGLAVPERRYARSLIRR
ncbi:MAG TPA: GNAT family N-acetyltransferase [Acidimicrobiales bacterium]